ncbi:MAG: hypothetical protein U0165_16985 [Polyangiaceae bacterium]
MRSSRAHFFGAADGAGGIIGGVGLGGLVSGGAGIGGTAVGAVLAAVAGPPVCAGIGGAIGGSGRDVAPPGDGIGAAIGGGMGGGIGGGLVAVPLGPFVAGSGSVDAQPKESAPTRIGTTGSGERRGLRPDMRGHPNTTS